MNAKDFTAFKNTLIDSQFTGDIMFAGYLFLSCTEKQIAELKELAKKHAKSVISNDDGSVVVGMYVFR